MMVDPGTTSADLLKAMSLPSTKSKTCGTKLMKTYLDTAKSFN